MYKIDSGGPLQRLENVNGSMAYIQHGIASFSLEKGALGVPGIHTNVSQYMDWIVEQIENSMIDEIFS